MLQKQKRVIILILIAILTWLLSISLNDIHFNKPYSYTLYSSNHELMDIQVSQDEQWRFKMDTTLLPEKLITAIIVYEDRHFFLHHGVDIMALLRASELNIKNKRIVSGGSTVTMQVARMYYNNSKRTYLQKIKEIGMAWYLEFIMSKDDILKLYLENAPFGGNVVGIEAASWRYFARSPHTLSWAESALLAIMPNNPANINLQKNRILLKKNRNKLLKQLYQLHIMDKEMYEMSIEEEIPDSPKPFPHEAPHLLQYLIKKYPSHHIFHSTINEHFQRQAYLLLQRYQHENYINHIRNAGIMIVEVRTGNVLTYIGNYKMKGNISDAFDVNTIESKRSGGSILKPFLYAAMLEYGELLPNMLIPDVPIQIGNYAPKNFNRGYDGAVRAHAALSRSLNVPAVKMLQWFGIQRFMDFLKNMGFTTINQSQDYYGLSLILGGCEVKLSELMQAYTNMAWLLCEPPSASHFSLHYLKHQNDSLNINMPLNKGSAWLTLNAMIEVERPSNERYWFLFNTKKKIAWKTGTSFGFRDAWAIGISADYVVGVWLGNATGEGSAELTGINKAAPLLFDIFSFLPEKNKWFNMPYTDLQVVKTCQQSGYPASPLCTDITNEIVCKVPIKQHTCPYHKYIFLDNTMKYRVNSDCEAVQNMVRKIYFILPPTMEKYYCMHHSSYQTLPPFRNDCITTSIVSQTNMEVVYPQNYTNLVIPRNLDGSPSSILFEVSHRYSDVTIYWYLDGTFLGQTKQRHQLPINTNTGKHTLTLQDEFGETKTLEFNVLYAPPS